jgi:PAS domain S-box-containing protein
MYDSTSSQNPPPRIEGILKIVLCYAAFAALWILVSDKAVYWLIHDPLQMTLVGTIKGWLFVLVTSFLLYALMRRLLVPVNAAQAPTSVSSPLLWLSLVLGVLAIIVLTAGSIVSTFRHEKDNEGARLQTISELKASQIADWIKERDLDGHFVQSSRFFAETYRHWRDIGDNASGDILKKRLDEYRRDRLFDGVLLLDEDNEVLWNSEGTGGTPGPALQAAVRQASGEGQTLRVGPYLDANDRIRLDLAAPLLLAGNHRRPTVVLRVDPGAYLSPTLGTWPVPSESGEMLLFWRDGEDVVFLNEHRNRKEAGAILRSPLSDNNFLAAQLIRGVAETGDLIEGVDYWGTPVLGVAWAVSGTNWFVLAKVDQVEAFSEANRDALWIALTGLLAFLVVVAAFFLFRKHHQLLFSLQERETQAEKLRALQLLDAIAESSDDAIYAKDKDGRYLFFNREAARLVGKNPQGVVGRDDMEIFPPDQAAAVISTDRRVMESNRILTVQEDLSTVEGEITFLATKGPLNDASGNVIGSFGISHNITELKRAEEAMLEAAQLLAATLESTADGILAVNKMGNVISTNTRFREIWQIPNELMATKDDEKLLAYVSDQLVEPQIFIEKVKELYASNEEDFDTVLFKDGRVIERFSCPLSRDGLAAGRVWSFRDVTIQKKAEEALRESEQKYRLLAENVSDVIFTMGLDMGVTYISPSAEKMYGWTVSEWQFLRPADYLLPESLDLALRVLSDELAAQGTPDVDPSRVRTLEIEQYRKDGTTFWTEVSATLLLDHTGTPCGIIGATRDITERKRSDAERTLLATAVEQAEENILVTYHRRNILYINPAFERSSGYRNEELKGRKLGDLRSAQHDEAFYRNMKENLDQGQVWMGTIINKGKDGSDFEIEGTISPIRDASGSITHYLAVGRNMSRFRKLEKELHQAQKMESVGRLAGGIAHDFNNMLGVIIGHAELALSKIDSEHTAYGDMQEILKAGNRSANLTRQLLAFARKQTIRPEVLDINETVESMLKMVRRLIGEDIELIWKPCPDLWPVKVDPTQIDQTLANLCVNARDAIAGEGKISIETGNVTLDEAFGMGREGFTPREYVVLSVTDNG